MIHNIFTIDLEDWCHSIYLQSAGISFSEPRIRRNTGFLQAVLKQYGVKATFFVLGQIAERMPDLLRELRDEGHEIASHGYAHRLLDTMTAQEVGDDIHLSCGILEKAAGVAIKGYRAPAWSMPRERKVLFDSLRSCGIEYDSSCAAFSVPFIWRATGASSQPFWADPEHSIIELPPTSIPLGFARVPVAGGVSLRLYPYEVTRRIIAWCNKRGQSVIVYVHPWDLDVDFTPLPLPWPYNVFHYANRHTVLPKVISLFREFSFCTMAEHAHNIRKWMARHE